MKKTLIMPIGLARSGKSTWAKSQNLPIISADAVRLALHGKRYDVERESEVWDLMYLIVESLFLAGNSEIILDATSLNKESRDKWRERGYDLKFKIFRTSPETCKERAILTDQMDLIPVINVMAKKLEFSEIIVDDILDEESYWAMRDFKEGRKFWKD